MAENAWELVVNETTYLYEVTPLTLAVLPNFPGYEDLPAASYPATIAALRELMVTQNDLPEFAGTDDTARTAARAAQADVDDLKVQVAGLWQPPNGTTGQVVTKQADGSDAYASLPPALDETARTAAATASSAAAAADAKAVSAQSAASAAASTAGLASSTASSALAVAQAAQNDVNALETLLAGGTPGSGSSAFFRSGLVQAGTLTVGTALLPGSLPLPPGGARIREIRYLLPQAPVGTDAIVQTTVNGNVVATTTVPAGKTLGKSLVDLTLGPTSLLNVNVTQVGGATPGANLSAIYSELVYPTGIIDTPGMIAWWSMAANQGVDGQKYQTLIDSVGGYNPSYGGSNPNPLYEADAFGAGRPGMFYDYNAPGRGFQLASGGPLAGLTTATIAVVHRPTGSRSANKAIIGRQFGAAIVLGSANTYKFLVSSNGTSYTNFNPSTPVAYDQNHVTIARLSGTRMYLEDNGVALGDIGFTAAIAANANYFGIGMMGGESGYDGYIGDVLISNQYLTGSDLSELRTRLGQLAGLTL